MVLAGGAVVGWLSVPAEYESVRLEMDTENSFRLTWNGGEAGKIAGLFRAEVKEQIAKGLPGFVREAGFRKDWPHIGLGECNRKGKTMNIAYPIYGSGGEFLWTEWEWRDGRWTVMKIDFGD